MIKTCLLAVAGCGAIPGLQLPNESTGPVNTDRYELIARFVHITDAQIIDEESPARLVVAAGASTEAWRPQEAYSTQLLDGMVRTINKMHVAERAIDFVIHTGDAVDNAQANELDWFITAMDGGRIDPRSGPDDRDADALPDPLLDPHHPFDAHGLYRNGVHGPAATIPWYGVMGNHDHLGLGVFPIVDTPSGRRVAPLPLDNRVGIFAPIELDPTSSIAWSPITPANPGPPDPFSIAVRITPNPARRYITDRQFVDAHLSSETNPPGHGFDPDAPDRTWYSTSPVPGLRLIVLNTASPPIEVPPLVYSEGATSPPQVAFLERELKAAEVADEWVIVATHHPSESLDPIIGTSLTAQSLHRILSAQPCVKLHIAGHWHNSAVIDRDGYIEIVTASIIDAPQQGRVIELWRERIPSSFQSRVWRTAGWRREGAELRSVRASFVQSRVWRTAGWRREGAVFHSVRTDIQAQLTLEPRCIMRYWMFSHLDEIDPPDPDSADLFDDPLMHLRRIAAELAGANTDGE